MPPDQAFLDKLTIRLIGRDVAVTAFKCEEAVDWFIKDRACEYHEKRITCVFCWLHGEDLAGYITTSMTEVELLDPPQRDLLALDGITRQKDGPFSKKFPGLLIGMLGVAERFQGRGLAFAMVQFAIGQAHSISRNVGCRFVSVDSDRTERATKLYRKANFVPVLGKGKEDRKTVWMFHDLGVRREEGAAPSP